MNSSKLKALLITACCLVLALFTKSQAMDDASYSQGIRLCKNGHREIYLERSRPEADDIGLQGTRLQTQPNVENDGSSHSWVSYVTTPMKVAINKTCEFAGYSVKHARPAIITTLIVAAQFTGVAAYCNCIYYNPASGDPDYECGYPHGNTPVSLGLFQNSTACQQLIQVFAQQTYPPLLCYYGCF